MGTEADQHSVRANRAVPTARSRGGSSDGIITGPSRRTAVDLFSGCGGLSLGLKLAGFEVVAAVEIDRKAQETYVLNHPGVHLFRDDIRSVDPSCLIETTGIARGELDLLAGCPPCQGFSRLRTRNRGVSVDDFRNDLVGEFLKYIQALQPKCVMMENVPSLAKDARFENLLGELRIMGYRCTVQILDAASYGVPQRRRRLILLASRMHDPFISVPSLERVTVRDAISDIEAPSRSKDALHAMPERRTEAIRALIRLIPKDGGSRADLGAEFQLDCHQRTSGFHDVYGRMRWDDVAPTITSGCHNPSKGRYIHPSRNRTITLREAAILQGFPADYRFDIAHGKESIALMIGNALPPPFIAAQASALLRGLRGTAERQ